MCVLSCGVPSDVSAGAHTSVAHVIIQKHLSSHTRFHTNQAPSYDRPCERWICHFFFFFLRRSPSVSPSLVTRTYHNTSATICIVCGSASSRAHSEFVFFLLSFVLCEFCLLTISVFHNSCLIAIPYTAFNRSTLYRFRSS